MPRDPASARRSKKKYYDANRQLYLDRNNRRRAELYAMIRLLKEIPCADCQVSYPYFVMDFDHREGEEKVFEIANAVRSGLGKARILAEVAKCDVVCANCHRYRTATRLSCSPTTRTWNP